MEKTTQDKETKEKFEEFVTKECGGDLWGDDGTGHYEASLYDVKDKVWDFISSELDKAREEGREEGINAVLFPKFKRDKNGTLKREGWVNTSKLKDNK